MTSRRLLTRTAHALLDAADYMEKHGHCKGNFRSWRDGSVCAVGAISYSGADADAKQHAVNTLGSYLREPSIPSWNDRPSRTAREVIDALRGAATHPMAQDDPPVRAHMQGDEVPF